MNTQQFPQYSDLGFEPELNSHKNYPEHNVTAAQLERERKMNLEIIKDNGEII